MIQMSYQEIEKKVLEGAAIGKEEFDRRIKQKMDQLSGLISKDGAAYIVANDLGIKLIQTEGIVQIKNIITGMKSIETAGKVVRKFNVNEFEKDGKKGKVGSFILADSTGQIRITAWHDMTDQLNGFSEGSILKIMDGYVRDNQGQKEIHLNSRSRIIVDPEGLKFDDVVAQPISQAATAGTQNVRKSIMELTESDQNVEILATVVQLFDPKFYEICPECQKRMISRDGGFSCADHGPKEPAYSYVVNAFLDDGTDNIRCVFFRNQANNLFKMTDEQMTAFRNSIEAFDPIKTKLLGEQVKVVGRVTRNQMMDRLELVARFVDRDIDPAKEADRLKQAGIGTGAGPGPEEPKKQPLPSQDIAKMDNPRIQVPEEIMPKKEDGRLPSIDDI